MNRGAAAARDYSADARDAAGAAWIVRRDDEGILESQRIASSRVDSAAAGDA